MKTYRLERELWVPQERNRIFQFFADPRNLERLTPPWLHFETLTAPETSLRRGTLLDYRLRLHGFRLRWQSEIKRWDPPHSFVDRQTRGPYSFWEHEHTFVKKDAGTLVADHVEYAVPGGWLVQKFLVSPDLERIFRFRHRVLKEIFDSGTTS
jgi:ligand-binding SRPBCC domain-containing protein